MQCVVDDCLALNSNRLARMGVFHEGKKTQVNWESGANIGLAYCGGKLELLYNLEGEPNNQTVRITKAPCHFGGFRYYLHCPRCGGRRYKLHLAHSGFYCRKCYQLPYYSQECGHLDGLIRKVHKLEARLEGLPKHTRNKTVDRLVARLEVAEREFSGVLLARIGAFKRLLHGMTGQ